MGLPEGITVTPGRSDIRAGDEAKVTTGVGSLTGAAAEVVVTIQNVLARLTRIETHLFGTSEGEKAPAEAVTTVVPADTRPGDVATTEPAPAVVAPLVAAAATGDATQPAEEDRETAIARMPEWAQNAIRAGQSVAGI